MQPSMPQGFSVGGGLGSGSTPSGDHQEESPSAIRDTFSRILQARGPLAHWPSAQQAGADGAHPSQDSLTSSNAAPVGLHGASLPATLATAPIPTSPMSHTMPRLHLPHGGAQDVAHQHLPHPPAATWHAPGYPVPAPSGGTPASAGPTVTFRPATSTRGYGSIADGEGHSNQGMRPSLPTTMDTFEESVPSFQKARKDLHELHLLKIWPAAFTFSCILLFLVPLWLTTHLAHDRTVIYWLGSTMRLVMFIPFLFVIGHIEHQRRRAPYKPAVLLCMLAPSIILLAFNDATMTAASDKADQLFSVDCDTFTGKRELQRSWDAAKELYDKCLEDTVRRTASDSNLTLQVATQMYRIQDCEEYPSEHYLHKNDWEYLWYLEEEHSCAGWCTRGERLWTYQEATDGCSVAASQVFSGKVARISQQVVLYSVVVLVSTSVALIGAGPFLRAKGIDW